MEFVGELTRKTESLKILDNGNGEAALRQYLPPALYERLAKFGLKLFMVKSRQIRDDEGRVRHTIDEAEMPRLRYAGLLKANDDGEVGDAFYEANTNTIVYTKHSPPWAIVHEAGHAIASMLAGRFKDPALFVAAWCMATYGRLTIPQYILDAHAPTEYATVNSNEYWAEQVAFNLGVPVEGAGQSVTAKPDKNVRDFLTKLSTPQKVAA